MTPLPLRHRRALAYSCVLLGLAVGALGCEHANSGVPTRTDPTDRASLNDSAAVEGALGADDETSAQQAEPARIADGSEHEQIEVISVAGNGPSQPEASPNHDGPPKERSFREEGPDGALRIGFDDLDLLKLLRMDPVTPDCDKKMPAWLKDLNGKPVRIRGYMKPDFVQEGIRRFLFVRDTGLCCFGPKGQIYDMIGVSMKSGTTTDYIELKPFDVVGTFRIQVESIEEDGMVIGLYYIDDARIVRR